MKKIFLVFALLLFPFFQGLAAQLEIQTLDLNNRTLPLNAIRVPFVQLRLTAQADHIEIKSLTLKRSGLSSFDDFGRIWAETKNDVRTDSRQLSNKDTVVLRFRNPLQIAENQTETLTIYANLKFQGSGLTATLSVIDIEHSGETTSTKAEASEEKLSPALNTRAQNQYDRTRFRIRCVNQLCQLVPRS